MSEHTRPHIGVALIVRAAPRYVLMHERFGSHAGGQVGFPGGHMEMWEDFLDTALREFEEECGSKISVSKPKYWCCENTFFKEEGRHFVVHFLVCDWEGGAAINMEPEKGTDWSWEQWDYLEVNHGDKIMCGIQQLLDKGMDPFNA